jgi:glycosyltransferase involved in cell wall biosynthesis
MEVILLDNGLTNRGEHSYHLVKEAAAALAQRNLPYRIFATKALDPAITVEMGALAHFTYTLYDHFGALARETLAQTWQALREHKPLHEARWPSERRSRAKLNAAFRRDLEALPPDVWAPDNLIVLPAISQNQIFGLIEHVGAMRAPDRPRIVCHLMFAPDWTPWGKNGVKGEAYYREAFAQAAPLLGHSLFFTTENEAMASLYRQTYGIDTKVLPIPFGAVPLKEKTESATTRLGVFGYSKTDKGFHLLPQAVALCGEKNLAVQFVVQIQHSGWEHETMLAERALRVAPNVRVLDGVLTSETYFEETNNADVILLPYDPQKFGLRGSAVFTESVAAGRPIIASEGTFAALSIAKGEAEGEIFTPYDGVQLAHAIERLLPRLSDCRVRARARAAVFAQRHSGEAYVEVLLGHLETRPAPSP